MAVGGKDLGARQQVVMVPSSRGTAGGKARTSGNRGCSHQQPHTKQNKTESALAAVRKVPEHPQKHHHSKTPNPQVLIEPATDPESRKDKIKMSSFIGTHTNQLKTKTFNCCKNSKDTSLHGFPFVFIYIEIQMLGTM